MSESVNEYQAFYEMVKKWTVSDYRTQKIKAEVIVDMLISDYIEEIMSQSLGKNIKLIAKEFPIARIGQPPTKSKRQYASVDFLMWGENANESVIYLVELKTSDDSFDGLQLWNMLWTCEQGSDSLYNRFYDIIINYGIKEAHGNEVSTKKYQYTLSKYAADYKLKGCEEEIKSFGKKLPRGDCPLKTEQENTAINILNSLKKLFDNAKLQIVYVGLNNEMDFAGMANSAFHGRVIQKKIADNNNAVEDFFTKTAKIRNIRNDDKKEIAADISSFIFGQNIEKILLTDFVPSEEKKTEWNNVKDILVELQKPWGKEWFDVKKL